MSANNPTPVEANAALTKKMVEALLWFERNGPAALFSATDPSRTIRKRLEDRGLIETAPTNFGMFQRYQISAAGRAALSPDQPVVEKQP